MYNMNYYKLVLVCCLFSAFIGCREKTQPADAVVFSMSDTMMAKCEFAKATKQEVQNEIRLFGKITADNNKLAQVYPIVSGIVKKIQVELGDYVKQGQVLATIQSSEVAAFQKEKMDAINDVANAEKNLQVTQDLFAGKLSTEKDVAAAERELEKARAELARINEIYSIYNLKGGSMFNVTAPISGFVVAKNINQNELLRQDNAEAVFSIAEINEVWALANVNETDIAKINVGYGVTVNTLAFPDQPYSGKIDKIFNAIDPETKS
ncbi:MAG: efflux transporter periplasmic adaptor subunit, partial [Flavihumibacter sp. CACIAM 22H1]